MQGLPETRVTVLISGEGSNLQALIDARSSTLEYMKIVRVISNKINANGLNRAKAAGIPTTYHNLISGKYHRAGEPDKSLKALGREKYDADLASLVIADNPDIVICAGFMHILTTKFLDPLNEREIPVINLHPALHGKYDGMNAIERAYEDFQDGKLENNRTGVMIHHVVSEVDRGKPLVQRYIECNKSESLKQLTERMHRHENQIVVEGIALMAEEIWKKRFNLHTFY
ncbi:Phosphoribosylglycinamide formyltransferase [Golovinomyces cichoracearum]|uniref:Phosphoribosylglycinamide formyltransferase n=1 Tax=Golovinomyces cichoracearum TaxID=62708 RepID=A0A420IE90_9PEZI|nr:Phosphoribosylglycinamide formyltransferase [Golovinomyces cichoracearum]